MFDDVALEFNERRAAVRTRLGLNYEVHDEVISLGDDKEPLVMRGDIYKSASSAELFYFLDADCFCRGGEMGF